MIHHFIFPHKHKKRHRKAHLLSLSALGVYLLFFVLLQVSFATTKAVQPGVLGTTSAITGKEIINLTNIEREKKNLSPLKENDKLDQAAEEKAKNMFEKNYWAHNSPDGLTPWTFIKQSGYDYVYAGENLARGFYNSQDVEAAWMASKEGHKENILSGNFKEIGVAAEDGVLNGEKTTLVVQMFGNQTTGVAQPEVGIGSGGTMKSNTLGSKLKTAPSLLGKSISIDPYKITKNIAISLIILLSTLGLFDILLTWRHRKVINLYARHIPHLAFIVGLVIVLLIFKSGAIL